MLLSLTLVIAFGRKATSPTKITTVNANETVHEKVFFEMKLILGHCKALYYFDSASRFFAFDFSYSLFHASKEPRALLLLLLMTTERAHS